jgi:hypothetical protein
VFIGWLWKLMARLSASASIPNKPATDAFYIYGPGKRHATVLITCLGMAERDLPPIVTAIERRLRAFDKRVYLTDASDFSSFVEVAAPFEYFPSIEDQHKYLRDAPWSVHLRTRYDRLMAKWRPSLVVSYGMPVDQFISGAPKTAAAVAGSSVHTVQRGLVLESDG